MNYRPVPEPVVGINMMKHSKGSKLPKEFLPVRQLADIGPAMKNAPKLSHATKFARDFLEEKKRMELLDTYKEKLSQQMNTNSGYEQQVGTNTFVTAALKSPVEKGINTIPSFHGDDPGKPPMSQKLPPPPKQVEPSDLLSNIQLPPPPPLPAPSASPSGSGVVDVSLQQIIQHHHHIQQYFHDNRQHLYDNRQFIHDSRQNVLNQDLQSQNILLNTDQLNTANSVRELTTQPEQLALMSTGRIEEIMDFEDEPQVGRIPLQLTGPVVTSPIGQPLDPQQIIEYQKVQNRRQVISSLVGFQRSLAQESRSAEQKLRNLAQSSRSKEQQLRNAAQASRSADQKLKNAANASRSQLQKMRNLAQASRSQSQRLKNLEVQPYDSPLLAGDSLSPSTIIEAPPKPIRGAPEYTKNIRKSKTFTRVADPGWFAQGLDDKLPVQATKRKGRSVAEDSPKRRK